MELHMGNHGLITTRDIYSVRNDIQPKLIQCPSTRKPSTEVALITLTERYWTTDWSNRLYSTFSLATLCYFLHFLQLLVFQCFDTVGWAAGRASGL